jgi:hypothetical protein
MYCTVYCIGIHVNCKLGWNKLGTQPMSSFRTILGTYSSAIAQSSKSNLNV